MQGKYIHVLLSSDTGERLESDDAPIGWDSTKINLVRDLKYLGVLKTITVEFQFIGAFYELLQRHRLRYGWDMNVMYRCYLRKGMVFQFEGKINSTPSGSENRKMKRWKCEIIQSTAVQKFQNRNDTELNVLNEISLDQLPVAPALRQPAIIRSKRILFYSNFSGQLFTEADTLNHILPFWLIENGNPGVQQVYDAEGDPDDPFQAVGIITMNNCFYVNTLTENQTVQLKWDVNFSSIFSGSEPSFEIKLRFRLLKLHLDDDNNVVIEELKKYDYNGAPVVGNFSFNGSDNIVVEPGYGLLWVNERLAKDFGGDYVMMNNEGLTDFSTTGITYNTAELEIYQDSIYADSTHPVILPLELFENLVAQINGMAVYSEVFGRTDRGYDEDGEFALLGVTTGLWLRGVDIDPKDEDQKPKFNTSFSDAFTSYNWPVPLGVHITDTEFRIDTLDKLFNHNVNADLGEVDDYEIQPLTEFMHNEVLLGYPLNEYEQQNGRDEPNTTATYTNSLQVYKKKYDLRSVYCGDSYGIEFARRAGIVNTGSADTKYDEKIFFIDLVRDEEGNLMSRRLEDILLCEGVFSPETMMNVRISNGQNTLRHRKMLNVTLDKKPDKVLYFQSKSKNAKMRVVTTLGDTTEGQNINLGTEAYFLPNAGVFKLPIKVQHLPGILANPLGLTKYTYEGENFYDLLLNVDAETEKHTSTWRMIATMSSPPDINSDTQYGNIIKYGDGLEDFIKYGENNNDNIKYAD